jgi:hypothetical protein
LLVGGLLLVTFYGGARLESWLASRAALKQFAGAAAPRDSDRNAGTDYRVGESARGSSSEQLELPTPPIRAIRDMLEQEQTPRLLFFRRSGQNEKSVWSGLFCA